MDYYSNYDPPLYEEALEIIEKRYLDNIVLYHKNFDLFANNLNMEIVINNNLEEWRKDCLKIAFEKADILNEKNYIKYSLSGWCMFGINDVIKELIKNSELFYIKKLWESSE